MIDDSLVKKATTYIVNGEPLPITTTEKLVDAYTSLTEQNAGLHKELAKLKGERVFVTNNTKKWIEPK